MDLVPTPSRFLFSSHGASLFGAERVLLALAGGLAARGHDVVLELPHDGPALAAAQQLARVRVTVTGRRRLPRNAPELLLYTGGLANSVRRLHAASRAGSYDVIWINSLYNLPAALAARHAGAVVVWHLHERNFVGALGWLTARVVRALCDVVVVPSRFVAASFAAASSASAPLRVVPNALLQPITSVPTRTKQESFVVGYVGQFEPRKRAADVVEALGRLEGVNGLLVGDGKARRAVEAVVARLHLEKRVRFTGFQSDVRPLLAESDCVVVPSRNEPFGLVALEAMAAGRPVIAADSGALPEVLGDAALYYPLGDSAALAACVERLRADASLGETLRARGLVRVQEFSLERMLDRVEAVAHDALAARRHARTAEAHA
jgi:glycosyltransferase involved in cell wall biosynthesis